MEARSLTRTYTWIFGLTGVASILFGLLAVLWPGLTLTALVLLFGVYAAIAGILSLLYMADGIRAHRAWWPALLFGIVDLAAAVFIVANPGLTAITLLYLVAFWAIFSGTLEILASLVTAQFLLLITGLLALAAGFVLLGNPQQGALALVIVIGIFAIVRGIIYLVHAIRGPELLGLRIA
jgi:uncharacterized membrane protein HdeD (DUF308 family)